jgi:dephospho-CoA kinase
MLRVALTGGIATGKSYCLAKFASLGVPVVDADKLAREVVAPGSQALAAVAERFGPAIVRADGSLDRAALARIVFSDRAARADLEAIVHPEVYHRIGEWFASMPAKTRLAIADVPLLFETGHNHDFDRVIVTACSPAEQMRRLVSRYVDLARESIFYVDPHICVRCRYRSTELLWQCPHCHEWNTFVEERIAPAKDTETSLST